MLREHETRFMGIDSPQFCISSKVHKISIKVNITSIAMYSIAIATRQKKYKGQTIINLDAMKLKHFFLKSEIKILEACVR